MSEPKLEELAAQVLREATEEVEPVNAFSRARTVALMQKALREQAERNRRQKTLRMALAACAVAVVGVGVALSMRVGPSAPPGAVVHNLKGQAKVFIGDAHAELAEGSALTAGSRILTEAEGSLVVAFATGSKTTLAKSTDLELLDSSRSQQMLLRSGALKAEVAKLLPDQRFRVETADTEVEVRGTVFEVITQPAQPGCLPATAKTQVKVQEGVVLVRHAGSEARLTAGMSWPDCSPPPPPPTPLEPPGPKAKRVEAPLSASLLREQNEMYLAAMEARERGELGHAVTQFDALLAKFDRGPLLESALVERMRALEQVEPGKAKAAAKDYLKRFPQGFARDEAQRLVEVHP